ncbi:hypothetical protein MVLG_04531 [Microbotryum lychnidis-dioicae p1A1 Lamole]|uniref:NAD(P)-binding protein n=1 Tax=Microbotryum lychnidis-dioicae (strain p1A1 Lamole / MvSl-1064) TaxID=683840 RepID=U5HBI1_USTV1|nr:hypothetical protein MVLG_04531 [Microbotryum lychnidis-dioicae p1A1 Lamole]|eukprot:KDE05091.1 hypothetical protein MVLG_04531 [Microbotryum lychnidis-dioicae p1A1 Lamole]
MANQVLEIPQSFPPGSFKGRIALITGGSSGIGLSTTQTLLSLDCNVVIGDLSPPPSSLSDVASKSGAKLTFQKCNVADYSSLLALFKHSKSHFGAYPSLVFANAGIAERGKLFTFDSPETDPSIEVEPDYSVIDIDLKAVVSTVRIGMWGIKQNSDEGAGPDVGKDASIVITASMAGYAGQGGLPVYNAAKHGCIGLVRSMRFLAPAQGVYVSCVAPAITMTPLISSSLPYVPGSQSIIQASVEKAFVSAGVPMNTPQHVANAVVYLMAEGSKASGKGILCQGGQYADLERGINASRDAWMSAMHARMYRSGNKTKESKGAAKL